MVADTLLRDPSVEALIAPVFAEGYGPLMYFWRASLEKMVEEGATVVIEADPPLARHFDAHVRGFCRVRAD